MLEHIDIDANEKRRRRIEYELDNFKHTLDGLRDRIAVAKNKRRSLKNKLEKHGFKNLQQMRRQKQILIKRKLSLFDDAENLLQEISNGLNSIGY